LHEVTVPAQATRECAQVLRQCPVGRLADRACGGLVNLPHRQRTEREVRAKAATDIRGGERGRERALVAAGPFSETPLEQRVHSRFTGRRERAGRQQPQVGNGSSIGASIPRQRAGARISSSASMRACH
jgi:hypothetical protein